MRCDHCGTPCTKRHPVVINRAVAMVGSDCARKFPRARARDLIRDMATYYKRYTLTREPPVETSGAFTNPWSLERFLSNYSGHGWERKKQSKKDEKTYGDRYAKKYGAITYELRVPSGLTGAMRGITVHVVPTKFPHGVEFETAYPLVAKHLDVEGLTMDDIERVVQELVQKYKELAKPRKRFQPDPERVSYKPRSHTYLDEDLQGKAAVDAWKKDVEDTIASILKNAGRQSITTGSVVGDVLDNHGVMMDGVSGNKQKRMVESILGSMARRRIIHRFTDAKRIEWKWRDPSDDSASTSGTRRKKPEKLAIVDVEKAIGVPVQEWPGRCHEISRRIVESGLVDGVAVYGHFRGGVSEGSMFERRRPFQRHGWVLLKGGRRILDPTRWVFEATEPYLYVGPLTDEYDEGGQQLRQQLATPPPPFNPAHSKFQLVLTPAIWKFVLGLLQYNDKTLSAQQVMWLASLPLPALGRHAKPIFEAVERAGLRSFIPIDNYRKVLQ